MQNKVTENLKKLTPSKILLFACISFIAGIFFASVSILMGVFFILLISFFFLPKEKRWLFISLFLIFLFFGVARFNATKIDISQEINSPVYGKVVKGPFLAGSMERVVFEHSKGKAYLYLERFSGYEYGDVLKVSGDFRVPEDKDYAGYLKKEGVYHTAFNPEIKKLKEQRGFFRDYLNSLRDYMRKNIKTSLHAPERFLAEAMLLGDRSSFSDSLSDTLSISGTRHITAISGMHVVIISGAFFYFLSFFKIKKKNSALLSILFIFLFVVFVGAPASAVRAGIMGSAFLLSYVFFREPFPLRLIFFAGAVMLFFNPLLLHNDLGFQLSFLATLGISLLSQKSFAGSDLATRGQILATKVGEPMPSEGLAKEGDPTWLSSLKIYQKLKSSCQVCLNFLKKPLHSQNRTFQNLLKIIKVTISAQLFVFPLILYTFGHVSLFSVPANVFIVPLLPIIMPLGFLTALTGLTIFAFPLHLLLSFILLVSNFFAKLPFSALYIENTPLILLILIYSFLFFKILKKSTN